LRARQDGATHAALAQSIEGDRTVTALTDTKAIVPTANAKLVISANYGTDVTSLMLLIQQHIVELRGLVSQLIKIHPTTGGDAANLASLNALLAELA
jgi:hypothetical protein